jgi:hypothetical protein
MINRYCDLCGKRDNYYDDNLKGGNVTDFYKLKTEQVRSSLMSKPVLLDIDICQDCAKKIAAKTNDMKNKNFAVDIIDNMINTLDEIIK